MSPPLYYGSEFYYHSNYMDFRIILVFTILIGLSFSSLFLNSVMTGGGERTIVLYYAPWCGSCKAMMPEWRKFVRKHKNDPRIKVRSVNSDKNPAAIKAANVDKFPTIILYKDGKQQVFNSERRAEEFAAFGGLSSTN